MERAKRIVDNHILHCQSSLIDHLLSHGLLFDDCVFLNDEIMEWWLVTAWLAHRLENNGETVVNEYGCHWWGRTTSGQAVYLDHVMAEISASFD